MNNPTLVVLAAGMGSRFGGLKQISPLGPNGEIIIDYSISDAYQAGFRHVVFVIKKELHETFKQVIGDKTAKTMEVSYAFQELDMLPEGEGLPSGRVKPWGTAHAVICAAPYIKGNFGIINADDFYGKDCYVKLFNFLKNAKDGSPMELCMVAYGLENTLTENGTVSRGVCQVKDGKLVSVTEHTSIRKAQNGGGEYSVDGGKTYIEISGKTPVSMNVWGFTQPMLGYMEKGFKQFLQSEESDKIKGEYYLPSAVDSAVKAGLATVQVLDSSDIWYGVTYAEDRKSVQAALANLHNQGKYAALR